MAIAVLSAPSNLGLRPPEPSASPGCAKAPEALREAGLYRRLEERGARDAGVLLPGRYVDDYVPGAGRLRNQDSLLHYSTRLARRLAMALHDGDSPLVLGGDCSLLLGVGQGLREHGRFGLVHIDGHTDFRHPANSEHCASLAGEDLAAAVGLHWAAVSLHGGQQHFDPADVVHLGCRDDDDYLAEVRAVLPLVVPASQVGSATAEAVLAVVGRSELDGYWLHLDVDVLDPAIMPAVDSPAPGGLSVADLVSLLQALAPGATGAHVTVFDPDLDPDGSHALLLAECLTDGLADLGTAAQAG